VLKNKYFEKWHSTAIPDEEGGTASSIQTIAKQRVHQARSFGYLGYPVSCPVMYLSIGELIRLITLEADSGWKCFGRYFEGSREVIKNKLEEIAHVRNALAHFRPIKSTDVQVIKQNSLHLFTEIEGYLDGLLSSFTRTPTNTVEDWYTTISKMSSKEIEITCWQSEDETWIRLSLAFSATITQQTFYPPHTGFISVTNLRTSNLLTFKNLAKFITYVAEQYARIEVGEGNAVTARKAISLTFEKVALVSHLSEIVTDLEELLRVVTKETELVVEDNLARGRFVELERVWATGKEDGATVKWDFGSNTLNVPVKKDDAPEYWGQIDLFAGSFVSERHRYPWIPVTISRSRWG
jgi:hypothetical protein